MPLCDEQVNVYLPSSVGSKRARLLFFITLVIPTTWHDAWPMKIFTKWIHSKLNAGCLRDRRKVIRKGFQFVCLFFNWSIVIWNVVLISAVQQSNSIMCVCVCMSMCTEVGNGNSFQYLPGKLQDRGAWQATDLGFAKSQMQLSIY